MLFFNCTIKMASFSSLTSFVTKPLQKSTHLNIYCHFKMIQSTIQDYAVFCLAPVTVYTKGCKLFCAGPRFIHQVMLRSTKLTLLLPQAGCQAQKSIGDMPEMTRDCG